MPNIAVQGKIQSVTLTVDGQTETLATAPYRFVLDPLKLKGGTHKLTLTVTDSQGQATTKEVGFTVPNAPAAGPSGGVVPAGAVGNALNPALLGVIAFAVVVLAGVVGFVLLRRSPTPAAKVRGPALRVLSGLEKGQVFPITAKPHRRAAHLARACPRLAGRRRRLD